MSVSREKYWLPVVVIHYVQLNATTCLLFYLGVSIYFYGVGHLGCFQIANQLDYAYIFWTRGVGRTKKSAEREDGPVIEGQSIVINDDAVNTHGITQFVADDTAKTATIAAQQDILAIFKRSNMLNKEQNLKDFFKRPALLFKGAFASTDGIRPASFVPMGIFSELLSLPIFANKISGLRGFRATTTFTLQVNANRFSQGRYIMAFVPNGGGNRTYYNSTVNMNIATITQRTTLPHVEIDLNCESQVSLVVPFQSSLLYYPTEPASQASTGNSNGNIGYLELFTYVALNSGSFCDFRIWVSFDDIEFYMPSVPQGIHDQEQKSAGIGPVETAARAVSTVAGTLSKVPLLSSYASPIKWAADITTNVASAMGWAKPETANPIVHIARNRGYQNPNVDGADMSIKMSYSCKNQVTVVAGLSGTDNDEMSLKYLYSIPAWYKTVTWNVSQALSGTLLWRTKLRPVEFVNGVTIDTLATQNYPPCAFPLMFMRKYRGSFKLRLKFVKTEFHTGRLSVVFVPYNISSGSVTSTYNTTYWTNRQILDIKYGNEWTLEFPYVQDRPYLDAYKEYGYMEVYVENDLQAPPTVAQSVTILVEVMGGDDLEYAEPNGIPGMFPYVPSAPQSGGFECEEYIDSIGTSKPNVDTTLFAEACIGEKITSLRQLTRMFCPRAESNYTGVANTYAYHSPGNALWCYPHSFEATRRSANNGQMSTTYWTPDFVTLFSGLYGLARGSMRLKVFNQAPTNAGACTVVRLDQTGSILPGGSGDFATITGSAGINAFCGKPIAHVPVSDGLTAEIQCPMYIGTMAIPVKDNITITDDASNQQLPSASGYTNPAYNIVVGNLQQQLPVTGGAPTKNQTYFLRAAGDDFTFMQFISIPCFTSQLTTYGGTGVAIYGPAVTPV